VTKSERKILLTKSRNSRAFHDLGWAAALAMVLLARAAGASEYGGIGDDTFCLIHHEYCTDSIIPAAHGQYIGQDEPSLVFYSDAPGAGNNLAYTFTLPKDPPLVDGRRAPGAIVNADLFETFWFGMAMCDPQSAPETDTPCVADSDANIYDNPDPSAPDYLGNHPGTAYMELQFYPPGTIFSLNDTHWDVSLNVYSVGYDQNTGIGNNQSCVSQAGLESINAAHLTRTGVSDVPAGPLSLSRAKPDSQLYLAMNPGDTVSLLMHDTQEGFQALVDDLTTGQRGSMTASAANGFRHVMFDPDATTCTSEPFSFHPMYSTAGEHTRVPWAVHSYNVGFVVEIGHAQPPDSNGDEFSAYSYLLDWPGTGPDLPAETRLLPQPIRISSPLTAAPAGAMQNYPQAGFEADLPYLESTCNGTTGAGCVNPPAGAKFYPIYTTGQMAGAAGARCAWQFGGADIAGTSDDFGGSSATEYADLIALAYPSFNAFADFRQVLGDNPCAVSSSAMPNLSATSRLEFRPERMGSTSAPQTVTVANRGSYAVLIDGISAAGDFAVRDTNCVNALAAGATCVAHVTFKPLATGILTGSLAIADDALNAPQIVSLRGKGQAIMVPVVTPSLFGASPFSGRERRPLPAGG
jgi:hypothetical protein